MKFDFDDEFLRIKSYEMEPVINPSGISYGILKYDQVEVQEVLVNGIPNGTYHLKTKNCDIKRMMDLIKKLEVAPGIEVGLVDPTGLIQLEYPCFIIVRNEMAKLSMDTIFANLDEAINRRIKNGR